MTTGITEPAVIIARATALEAARSHQPETFDDLATAFARANNLRDPELGSDADQSLMQPAEQALLAAIQASDQQVGAALAQDDFAAALDSLAALRAPIDDFFASTLIMDEDQAVREMRLKLLNAFVAVFANVADFGKMAKGK